MQGVQVVFFRLILYGLKKFCIPFAYLFSGVQGVQCVLAVKNTVLVCDRQ